MREITKGSGKSVNMKRGLKKQNKTKTLYICKRKLKEGERKVLRLIDQERIYLPESHQFDWKEEMNRGREERKRLQ